MPSSEQASQSALAPAITMFAELLEHRLKRGVFTTEDAVRYTFFIALVQALNLRPEDIVWLRLVLADPPVKYRVQRIERRTLLEG